MELKDVVSHENILLVNRGNTAIKLAFEIVKEVSSRKKVLIPDQAGWLSYKNIPAKNFEIVEVKTNDGLIDLEDLEEKSLDAAALICMGMPGYFVGDDLEKISSICNSNGCLIIEDNTANIGLIDNSSFVDFCICSFSNWKPINLGNGGMISVKNSEWFELIKDKGNFSGSLEELNAKLDQLKARYEQFFSLRKKVLEDLKDFNIIHPDKKGINVIVKFSSDEEKDKIISYCKEKSFEFVECPKYYKVMCDAISIELKRL
jgi:glycine/serine hydroxymethyltransferase